MIKKLLLFVVATLTATSMWSVNPAWGTEYADKDFPHTRYLTQMSFDQNSQMLKFTDEFQAETELVRDYYVVAAKRVAGYEFFVGGPWEGSAFKAVAYLYGTYDSRGFYPSQATQCAIPAINTTNQSSKGGQKAIPASAMRELIQLCVASGYTKVRLFINPVYRTSGGELSYYASDATNTLENKWYANFIDIDFPTIKAYAMNPEVSVDYTQSFRLDAKVFGVGELTYEWQKNNELNGSSWSVLERGKIVAADAKKGIVKQYAFDFNKNNMRPCNYRIIVSQAATGEKDTCTFKVNFRYPLTFPNSSVQYYRYGEEVIYGKGTVCTTYQFSGRFLPKLDESNPSYVRFTMTPCPLEMREVTAKYLVVFYDLNGAVLKSDLVECGEDAVAPTAPTVPGMEFVKWSEEYTNVRKELKIKPIYKVSGAALDLNIKEHKTHTNDYWKFNSNSHDYFTNSKLRALSDDSLALEITITAQSGFNAYICTGKRYVGHDEFNWNDGGYQKVVTGDEARAGKTLEWTTPVAHSIWSGGNPKTNEEWGIVQIAYRVKVEQTSGIVYSNPVILDVFYPLLIQSQSELTVRNREFWFSEDTCVIPAQAGDTLFFLSNEITAGCELKLNGTDQDIQASEHGINEEGITWFIPYGRTDQAVIAPDSFRVIFRAVNPSTHVEMLKETQKVACGHAAIEPNISAVEGYAFIGWASEDIDSYPHDAYMEVTEEPNGFPMQFNAVWEELIKTYHVTWWKNEDGSDTFEEDVNSGESANPPTPATKDGFTFMGWDGDYTMITSDTTFKPLYSEDDKYWTVTYVYLDDEMNEIVIGTETVKDGCDAVGVEPPVLDERTFVGWFGEMTEIHSDTKLQAIYELTMYHITFLNWDGTLLYEDDVLPGEDPHYNGANPEKPSTADKQYKWDPFDGWDPEIVSAYADAVYTAKFTEEPREFSVLFYADDYLLKAVSIQYGKAITTLAPSAAEANEHAPEGKEFDKWDKDISNIIADLNVYAEWKDKPVEPTTFVVTLVAEHGNIAVVETGIDLAKVPENTVLHFTATPDEGYEFKEWDGYNPATGLTVTQNVTVTAIFEEKQQGLEDLQFVGNDAQKVLVDGTLFIALPDGRIYNANGLRVK